MRKLTEIIQNLPEFQEVVAALDNGRCPAAVSGLAAVHRGHFAAALSAATRRPLVILTRDEVEGDNLERDLASLLGCQVYRLGGRDFSFHGGAASRQFEHKRLAVFHKMLEYRDPPEDAPPLIVVATAEGVMERTLPPDALKSAVFTLDGKAPIPLEQVVDRLAKAGYTRCDQVEGVGQFAQRGGILDVFSPAYDKPIRVEYWDEDIDSMGLFDPLSQRRFQTLDRADVLPCGEVLPAYGVDPYALDEDSYLPDIFPTLTTAVDYFPENAIVLWAEQNQVRQAGESYETSLRAQVKALSKEGFFRKKEPPFSLTVKALSTRLEDWPQVFLDSFVGSRYPSPPRTLLSVTAKQLPSFGGSLETAVSDLSHYQREGYAVTVLVASEQRALNLQSLLREEKVRSSVDFALHDLPGPGQVVICVGGLTSGVEYPTLKAAILTQGANPPAKRKRKTPKDASNRQKLSSYNDLHPGDLVVHTQHGIGRFVQLTQVKVDGADKEYMKIAYAGGDTLYVPITQLDLVSKYIGGNEETRRLSRLGGGDWDRAKSKTKKAVRDLAKGLVRLYAQRQRLPGYAFSVDSPWQKEFEEQFEYPETEDQLRCVKEIKRDMEQPRPMDRLLCGDVGYGKTEVALRAVMKCILDGKQAALLAPTTVLARQHLLTARARFAKYPVTVESMTRSNTPAQNRDILRRLEEGRVDLLVGTHRLLQKDIRFKDLGLLVVDEEQRFGVTHKERLKELFSQVDVLTLTATPIPRTLNMALSGIRDMSTLEEPPADRQPVQTYVLEHDWGVVADAIRREVERGGQVYYLHNRVETIARTAVRLQELLGDRVTVAVAHGRMSSEELSDVMSEVSAGQVDVLVCTTIIETGIDIPNVNTLIIEDADKLGLAQLHQIRGRVGRSSRRSFAYLTYRQGKVLSEVATKRLSAIREFAEFGSGFKIAMRDMEIRGAGNILGPEQSGFMMTVGYEMYLQLLEEAVLEEQGVPVQPKMECAADLNVTASIPNRYVPQAEQRMDLYRRIAGIRSEEEADDLTDELIDRYGDPPRAVNNLIAVALMRAVAAQNGFSEITQQGNLIRFVMEKPDLRRISALCVLEKYRSRLIFLPGGAGGSSPRTSSASAGGDRDHAPTATQGARVEKPALVLRAKKGEDPLRWAGKVMEDYAKIEA